MENASKALIIAGAILISIVLIAIGVLIVNNIQGTVDTTVEGMTAQEKQVFNSKFESYESNNQTPSNVKALLSAVISHNATMDDSKSETRKVGIVSQVTGKTFAKSVKADDLSGLRSAINSGNRYTVTLSYDGKSGLIQTITITTNTTTP